MLAAFLVLLAGPYLISALPNKARTNSKPDTLVLVHLFFRHGDRTPAVESNFPGNPYANETYFPYGPGQLTLQGKRRSYSVGMSMRKRYDEYLGPIYYPDLVFATSSQLGRTRMSLETMLAALFPAQKDYRIKPGLEWQPVVFDYIPYKEDKLIATYLTCPEVMDVQTKLNDKEREIYQYLTEKTGRNVSNSMELADIEDTFLTLERLGYELPDWIKPLWPEPLRNMRTQSWFELTDQKLSIISGGILKKINEDTASKIDGSLTPDRKMFIYAGHDTNIVGLLAALGVYDGREINYSAYLLFEVHKINGVYGMKVFLQNYEKLEPVLLKLPKCGGTFCPLETFIEITKLNYPKEPWCY